MGQITNENLYAVLLDIKEDIGGLKTASDLQLESLKAHDGRIDALEEDATVQKGARKTWGIVATGIGSVVGGVAALVADWFRHR